MMFNLVCISYNNSTYTRQALRSLGRDSEEYRIVVVDNHSDEENVEALKKLASEFQNVELILSKNNVGYFGGLNLGIRRLRSSQPDMHLVIVGNNDLVFPADFTDSLRRNLTIFEKYAVVSPNIVTLDGVHQNPHVIDKISRFRECIYDLYYADYFLAVAIREIAKLTSGFTRRPDPSRHEIAQEIYMGFGACYVLGPVFFRHFEELWAPTFLMHEEYFLSKQLDQKGLRIYYEPSIRVLHHSRASIRALGDRKAWEIAREAHKLRRQYVKVFG